MIPWFQWTTISLGPITIQVWGLLVALGLLLATGIIYKRAKKLGHNPEQLLDIIIWMVVGGFIMARIFHIVLYDPSFFINNPIEILKVWHGGLSSFGGIFGAAIGLWIYAKKHKLSKQHILEYLDILSFGAVYGWLIGRVGCVCIHDHWGIPCDCALAIDTPDGPRLDMALLEIIGLLPIAILFFFTKKKNKPTGFFLAILLIYYGVLRFILDFWRATDIPNPDARYLGLTPAQYAAIILVILGLQIFRKNNRNSNLKV